MLFLMALAVYSLAGFAFAVAFAIAGVGKIDPAARESGAGFRLIIFPGAAALWPLLLKRWIEARR